MMNKNEKLDLFKLIEPKFKKKYINKESFNSSDFIKYNLDEIDFEEFMDLYVSKWEHYLFWKDEIDNHSPDGLRITDDSVLYNFGVKNIDIFEFKMIAHDRPPVIILHKITGSVSTSWVNDHAIWGMGYSVDEINDFIIIEIKSYAEFFRNLEKGNMKEILSVSLFEKRYYEVPSNLDLYQAQKLVDLYLLASHLDSENEVFVYEDGASWWSFKNLAEIADPDNEEFKIYTKNALIYSVKDSIGLRTKLLNGDLGSLSQFKMIKNFFD